MNRANTVSQCYANAVSLSTDNRELSPRAREIVDAARELVEEEGLDALSMRRLADRLGIRAPSLYKHLPDKRAIENALISTVLREQGAAFAAAVAESDDPVGGFARAYRDFGRQHPALYRLVTERRLDRDHFTGADDAPARAIMDAVGGDRDVARALWAFAHGMTVLELDERFRPGADLDVAWEHGLNAFRRYGAPPRRAPER